MTTENTMNEMFAAMVEELGYEHWWECDGEWEAMEERMVEAGFDASTVREFFAEMEEEL